MTTTLSGTSRLREAQTERKPVRTDARRYGTLEPVSTGRLYPSRRLPSTKVNRTKHFTGRVSMGLQGSRKFVVVMSDPEGLRVFREIWTDSVS